MKITIKDKIELLRAKWDLVKGSLPSDWNTKPFGITWDKAEVDWWLDDTYQKPVHRVTQHEMKWMNALWQELHKYKENS